MKKYFNFLSFLFLMLFGGILPLIGQADYQNTLSVNVGRSFHTTGDYSGFRFGFEYEKNPRKKFDWGFSMNTFFAGSNKIRTDNTNDGKYPVIMKGVENAFPDFGAEDASYYDRGINSYTGSSDRIFQIATDFNSYYRIVNGENHILKIGLGASFAYVEESTIALDAPGTFSGEPFFSETPIRLLIPSYAKWVDLGAVLNLRYDYRLTERTQVGLRASWHNYFTSDDYLYSAGVNFGVLF